MYSNSDVISASFDVTFFLIMGKPSLINNNELTLSVDVRAVNGDVGVRQGDDNPLNETDLLAVSQREH